VETELVLTRFAVERLLYRLSRSRHAEQFVLMGALLMLAWLGESIRPTRDADLLGFGDLSDEALVNIFRDLCALEIEPDAMTYLQDSIRVAAIRDVDAYGGRRVTLRAQLGSARLRIQVDVGLGDAVSPPPEWLDYPSLLDLPRPRLRAYRPETVIAEKVHAMVLLGTNNSRMRDFFDVYMLAQFQAFNASAAGARRQPSSGGARPSMNCRWRSCRTADSREQAQWRHFLRNTSRAARPADHRAPQFMEPVVGGADGSILRRIVATGGSWEAASEKRGHPRNKEAEPRFRFFR
jgi:hypothetical protein